MLTYTVVGVNDNIKYTDQNSYRDVVMYICNPEKTRYIGFCGVSSIEAAAKEMSEVVEFFGKDRGKRVRHTILSFQSHDSTTPCEAYMYAKQIAEYYSDRFQIVFAVHENTDNLHVHFVMNMTSYRDGRRYSENHKDFRAFLNYVSNITGRRVEYVRNNLAEYC